MLWLGLFYIGVAEAALPFAIFYSATVRDFLAQPCRNNYDASTSFEDLSYQFDTYCPSNLGFRALLNNGTISGHPDFERTSDLPLFDYMFMSQTRPYSYSKYATGHKPFPVVFTPAPEDEDDYVVAAPFVTTDLSYGTTGVPKMTFCNEQRSLEEGYQCDYNQTKRQVFSQESFSTWYEDDRRFNKRMGYQQRLTLNASTKQYAYRSSNETKDFFDPIQLSDQLDKAWPMSFTETDLNNNKFWFTVEIHTSFQYNGTEVFTFSGDDDVHVFFNER